MISFCRVSYLTLTRIVVINFSGLLIHHYAAHCHLPVGVVRSASANGWRMSRPANEQPGRVLQAGGWCRSTADGIRDKATTNLLS